MPSIRKQISNATLESLKASTLHGVQNIIKTEFVLIKILWLVCLLGSASYFFYTMFLSITNFLEYPVETKITVRYVKEVPFPIVKFCQNDLRMPGLSSGPPTSDRQTFYNHLVYFRNLFKSNGESFHKLVGITNLSDIMISCFYNMRNCNTTDFSYYYDFDFGSCWQFNSGIDFYGNEVEVKKSKGTGLANGLALELYLGDAIDKHFLTSSSNAFEISISNETIDSIFREGIKIAPGISTHLTLERYMIDYPPKPYSSCIDNLISEDAYPSECYKKTFQQSVRQNRLYHYADCSYMCLQKQLTLKCNCYGEIADRYYPNVGNKCIEFSDIPCAQKVYTDFLNDKSFMFECDCPRECHIIDYSVSNSFTNYPTKYRADQLAKTSQVVQNLFGNNTQITHDVLAKSLTSIYIYFNELKEIKISQKPKISFFDLISQVGSQAGVFLGISFLSFIEILEILLQCVILICKSLI